MRAALERAAAMRTPGGGGYRYGAVLILTLTMATFALIAPDGPAIRVTELVVAGAALLAAMLTSGARPDVRRAAVVSITVALVLAIVAAILGAPPGVVALAATSVVNATTIAVIVGGLVRLVEERGVGFQSVFGALAIYLLLGLTFGFFIGAIASGFSGDYFAQGTDGTQAQRLYFSFTTLTTTGFGDLTARTPPGRAIAVLEMLIGQLYLVTVIATLVGNLRGRHNNRER
jgi:ion channel